MTMKYLRLNNISDTVLFVNAIKNRTGIVSNDIPGITGYIDEDESVLVQVQEDALDLLSLEEQALLKELTIDTLSLTEMVI